MLRFVRIALLVSVSFVAGATLFAGCNDDTTNTNVDQGVSSTVDLKAPADLRTTSEHD